MHPRRFFARLAKQRVGVVLGTILIIILILLLIGALPTWPYSTDWGYYPGGGTRPDPHYCPCPCSRRPIVTERPAVAGRFSSNRSYSPLWLWSD